MGVHITQICERYGRSMQKHVFGHMLTEPRSDYTSSWSDQGLHCPPHRISGHYERMNGEQRSQWDLANETLGMRRMNRNLYILHMLKDTFSLYGPYDTESELLTSCV